jgi:hypothetical protein
MTAVFWQAIVKAGGISILPFFYYISCSMLHISTLQL